MHYHLEIVMPPTDEPEKAAGLVLAPFDENEEESSGAFWDFWVLGGRWSGNKAMAQLDSAKLDEFMEMLKARKITVSGLQCGKQSLEPASQIPEVDGLWREWFPELLFSQCPLFAHSNDQYASDSPLPGDILRYDEVPDSLTMERIIFACYRPYDGKLEANEMFTVSAWNGVTHEKTVWDGTFGNAKTMIEEETAKYAEHFREAVMPKPDWLVVTVDYHS